MKFKFPLQSVLKHRKIKEDLAQKDFLEVVAILNQEVANLQKMHEDMHTAHLRTGELLVSGGQQAPALRQIHDFKTGQLIRIERQKARVQEVEKWVEDKREILRQAALEYKIIERLKEKKFEEFKSEVDKKNQSEMDEQSVLRHTRNLEKRQ